MSMVCPQCGGTFDQRFACPTCHARLAFPTNREPSAVEFPEGHGQSWEQTPWGRILVGLVLAQGLFYGLRHLCTAGLLALGPDALPPIWSTLYGLLGLQALQALAILAGGALAGAGQRRGVVFGGVVGLCSGFLSITIYREATQPLTAVMLYGQPLLQTGIGFLAGFVGSRIWRPLKNVALETSNASATSVGGKRKGPSLFAGKVAWLRVFVGTAVAVCGTLWARLILDWVLEASEGKLEISTHLQLELVTWEITALATLAGSALAGATRANCLKQGLGVGLASALLLIAIRLHSKPEQVQALFLLLASSLSLGLAGSWFGGQLFPPVYRVPRRKPWGSLGL